MASDLVNLATKETLVDPDWARNIQICEIASNSHEQAKDVIKAIKKRLGSKNPNVQLFAVALLEMLMNNCGEHIHKMVMETGLLRSMVKIVKKKSDLPVREKIFLLLDATQTALGGAKGKFPQYYAAYYDLVCAHVEFPQRSTSTCAEPTSRGLESNPSDSGAQKRDVAAQPQKSSSEADSSIIQKASSVMEVLQEVLNALDRKHPKGAGDEFTLDLVEQCSFQKQRVMHLAMTARDEKLVSQALKLNDQLDKLLKKHDELLSLSSDPIACGSCEDAENDDEGNHLSRRMRKGKASTLSWGGDEEASSSSSSESLSYAKPLPQHDGHTAKNAPLRIEPRDAAPVAEAIAIPPPPAKHKEREMFFKEKEVRGSGNANGTNSA